MIRESIVGSCFKIFFTIMVLWPSLGLLISCGEDAPEKPITKLEVKTLQHQGKERQFMVHLPDSYEDEISVPVVLVLHGGGGTMQDMQNFTQMDNYSDENGFIAVYPQGIASQLNGFSWADGRNTIADQEGIDDVGFIDRLLDYLLSEYKVDQERVYVCGFSNGGFMTQRLACDLNDRFAAMGSLGSIMDVDLVNTCNPGRAIPMLLLTGTEDPFVPIEGGEMIGSGNVKDIISMDELVAFWVGQNSCNPTVNMQELPDIVSVDQSTVTLFRYSSCDCAADVWYYRINGGGHTWPGVSLPLYEIIAGPTNRDIHASEELWKFFEDKRLCF